MRHGRPPTLTLPPFVSSGLYHCKQERESDPDGRAGYLPMSTRDYPSDIVWMLDGDPRGVVTTRDVVKTGSRLPRQKKGEGKAKRDSQAEPELWLSVEAFRCSVTRKDSESSVDEALV